MILSNTYGHVCMYIHMHTHHSYHFLSPQRQQTLSTVLCIATSMFDVVKPGSSQQGNNTKITVYTQCVNLVIN